MPHLIFRDATRTDIATILELGHAGDARGAETPSLDRDSLADPRYLAAFSEISADPNHRLIVAEQDDVIVGTLQISVIPGLPRFGMKRAMLENVHIRTDKRGQGLGREMVAWAIDQARQAGCGMVQLTSNKLRVDAHRFYKTLGFAASHEGFKLYF